MTTQLTPLSRRRRTASPRAADGSAPVSTDGDSGRATTVTLPAVESAAADSTTAESIALGSAPAKSAAVDSTAIAEARHLSSIGLLSVLIGVLLPVTDFFIVNVALPTMARDLRASAALLELVVAGYATSYAVLLVLCGRLGDHYGRRRLFLTGMTAFTVASLLCGLAPSAALLVGARVIQGAAAALMVPQTLSTIQATGDASSRAKGLAWYGATAGIAAVIGQVVGGLLVSADIAHTGWRPIFLVNVPIGIVGLVFALRFVPETRVIGQRSHLDWRGTLLLGATLVAVLVPLTEGRALGWPTWSWVLLLSAPLLAGAFAAEERRVERAGRSALLPPAVVSLRTMRRGLALICPFFAGFAAFMFVYALTTQGPLHFDALKAGLAIAPLAVSFLVASLYMPRVVARWGHGVIVTGSLIQFSGLLLLAATLAVTWPHTGPFVLAPAFIVVGVGQGLVMPALFRVILSEVPTSLAGAGSGVMTTSQQVSLALGVATLGTLYLTLAPSSRMGVEGATLVVVGFQALIAGFVALGAGRISRR
ncbi:MAG TPA: MFS transporter [Acidimicrobiales bacterium]|nr:MFS transporter [Acidimicrobiales bacterium]